MLTRLLRSAAHSDPSRRSIRSVSASSGSFASLPIGIGSDQVAVRDGERLGKPGDPARAAEQLGRSSGRPVEFLTAVCVVASAFPDEPREHVDVTRVVFRPLTSGAIARYLEADRPFDCAGSFRSESLGIALLERIDTQDPTALVGLPLIWLAGALEDLGLPVL